MDFKQKCKRLFSRFTLISLTIVLIFFSCVALIAGAIYGVLLLAYRYFPDNAPRLYAALTALSWLVVIITVFNVVNRDMHPECKLPWILCIVALNVLGVAIYLIFSFNRPTRVQQKRHKLLYEHSRAFFKQSLSGESLEKALGSRADLSVALTRSSPAAVAYPHTKTQYFPSGEQFFEALLNDLEGAQKYIFLEFFILAKGEMWNAVLSILRRKVQEGVLVRVMYDDVGSMGRVPAGYYRTLRKTGIQCVKFKPFLPVVTNLHNYRDHRKIIVIDGKIAYTGGINLGDEYINRFHRFGHWKDSAVRLEGVGAKSFLLLFLRMYNVQNKSKEDFTQYIPKYEPCGGEGVVQVYGTGPKPIYERRVAEDVLINVLNSARHYVYITTPYLVIDYRLQEAILLAARRGVDIRIVTPRIPDKKIVFALTRSHYLPLMQEGVKIYEYTPGFMHAKNLLCDDEVGIVGTVNLDYRSLMHHYECAALMFQTKALADLKQDFNETFALSELQTERSAKRNVIYRWVLEIAKVFAPLF